MLKIKSLSKKYGSHQVLRDVSLSLKRGDIHAILGANGAGKTTLFKCICGLESFTGEIEYDGGIIKTKPDIYLQSLTFFQTCLAMNICNSFVMQGAEKSKIWILSTFFHCLFLDMRKHIQRACKNS